MIYRLFTLILAVMFYCSPAHALKMGPMSASLTTYAPSAPVSVSGAAGNGQVTVSWSAGTVDGTHSAATSFNLWRGTSPGGESPWQSGVTSPYVDTASNGTGYYYKVAAVNSANYTLSAEVGPYTPTAAPTAPGTPTGVTATAGNAQATVTFTAPASNGGSAITGYTVTSSPAGGTDSNAGSTSLSHVVTGLTNGTAYMFTVTATNTVGTSADSLPSNSVTPSATYTATFDGTSGTAPDTSFFTVMTAGSGVVQLDGTGQVQINAPSASTDGALLYRTTAITAAQTKEYKVKFQTMASMIGTDNGGAALQIIHAAAKAAPLGSGNDNSINVVEIILSKSANLSTYARYIDSSGGVHELNSGTTWTSAGVSATNYVTINASTYYWAHIYTTSTGWSIAVKDATDTSNVIGKTAEIAWSNTKGLGGGESFWLRAGDKYSYAWQFGMYLDTYTEQ